MEIEKKQGLGRVIEAVAKAAEKLSGEKPAGKSKHKGEKPQEQKKASKKRFIQAPQELIDTFKQKLEQRADSELVKKIKERTQPQDARVLGVLNELLTVEETNKDYPHQVERAARRLKDLALEFQSAGPEKPQVATGTEQAITAQDARRCLRQLVEAYPEYKEKLEPIMLEAMPGIKSGEDVEVYHEAAPASETVIKNPDLVQKLKDINRNLRINSRYRDDVHRLNNDIQEISGLKGVPEDQIKEAIERINSLIKAAEYKGAGLSGLRSGDWILIDKDPAGKRIEPADVINPDGSVRSREELREVIRRIQGRIRSGRGASEDLLEDLNEIRALPQISTNITAEDVRPFEERIVETWEGMKGSRLELSPEVIDKIRDPKTRDEMFFERLKEVLDEPDVESHKQMGLYEEADLKAFMHVVSQLPDGDKLTSHYNNLKHAIFAFHDMDYYARHASGDIKSFKIAAHYFHNSYAVQAMSDPLVESMLQSCEQALKMIRDNNDGYIPSELVGYSATRHVNYWDELTKQIFEEKVKAGLIHDYERYENGLGRLDKEGRIFGRGKQFTEEDFHKEKLRVLATMQMAKGMGMLNARLLEIFAFSKVPGMASAEWGTDTSGPGFASIAYEGIARWFNPMGNFFGKFKPGESAFQPFFGILVGLDQNELKDFLTWTPDKWQKIAAMASEGTLHDWLQKEWGPKAGRMLDLVSEFAFSGRFGPLSGWGEHDATLGFTDLDREREGGSLRLFQAKAWAEKRLKDEFGEAWGKMKNTREGQEKLEMYAHGYQAWVWVQTALRSPTTVASAVRDSSETYVVRNETMPKRLRSVVIKQILGIDIETQVKMERTPDQAHRDLMHRIELLESDVMTVQQAALYAGPDGRPRNIEGKDFDVIKGTRDGIDEATRRAQAKEYCELVKKKMLGNWDEKEWERKLGFLMSNKGDLTLVHAKDADTILGDAKKANAILTKDLLDRRTAIHMGMEDVQWRYFDLETLGARHWARRANDLEARSNTIIGIMKYMDVLRPKPDLKEIGKLLEDIKTAEKEHYPAEGNKFVYYMARGTGEFYRQRNLGMFPIVGKLIGGIGPIEMSIAQQVYGKEYGAAAWSSNNMREFIGVVQQTTKLPYREVDPSGERHPYNIQKLQKELLASPVWAVLEIVGIGTALAALAMAFEAAKKSQEEDQ